jgi:hypothetical protein
MLVVLSRKSNRRREDVTRDPATHRVVNAAGRASSYAMAMLESEGFRFDHIEGDMWH